MGHIGRDPCRPKVGVSLKEVFGAVLVRALICVHPGQDLADGFVIPFAGLQIVEGHAGALSELLGDHGQDDGNRIGIHFRIRTIRNGRVSIPFRLIVWRAEIKLRHIVFAHDCSRSPVISKPSRLFLESICNRAVQPGGRSGFDQIETLLLDLDPKRVTIRTVPALLAKSSSWQDYCDGERPLEQAI